MIFLDDRAGSREFATIPPLDSLSTLTRLDSADACFTGHGPSGPTLVGVEIKTTSELVSSSLQGRLQATQIPAMLSTYHVSWLLHYGPYRPHPQDGILQLYRVGGKGKWKGKGYWSRYRVGTKGREIPFSFLESFLLTLSTTGVLVKHVPDRESAARWISLLYAWWQKRWDEHRGLRTFDKTATFVSAAPAPSLSAMPSVEGGRVQVAKTAATLPGIRYERAMRVAERFDSVWEMAMAGEEEWREVDGIGEVLSRRAVGAIRGTVDLDLDGDP